MHIVSSEEMYAIDQYAINDIGMSGVMLMENAGKAIFEQLKCHVKKTDRIGVIIGKGNNGGDGFVVARYLYLGGYNIDVWLVPEQHELIGDAKQHMNIFLHSGGNVHQVSEGFDEACHTYTYIIDALLGIGLKGTPRPAYEQMIQSVNQLEAKVVSIDVPSGVLADGKKFAHEAIRATMTLTLHHPKIGQYTFPAADYFGDTKVLDIGIPPVSDQIMDIETVVWEKMDVTRSLPTRPMNAHKGSHGKGLLIAGSPIMPGAVSLSALAAIRSGIGLLSVHAPESIRQIIATLVPEATYHTIEDHNINKSTQNYDAIAIGPGLGRDTATMQVIEQILTVQLPLVIDADGLYFLKEYLSLLKSRTQPTILTPHPGEMARLCGCSISDIEDQRFSIAREFAKTNHVYLVLKGHHTIVTTPDGRQFVNTTGNPSLAKGGSGDVLTGMILAFILQHQHIQEAISNAVFVHGEVADMLVSNHHSMLDVRALDIIDGIPKVMHMFYQTHDG